jgi:hypothetical protein
VAGGSKESAQGSHEDVRPISFKLNILKQNIKNGKPQIIPEENSSGQEEGAAQSLLRKDNA